MKVFRVYREGASVAIPEWFIEENRYAFFHGGAAQSDGRFLPGAYVLRLSKDSFPIGQGYNWPQVEYALTPAHPSQLDQLGNRVYVARHSSQPQSNGGECLCLLDMCRGQSGGAAILSSWNKAVTILGKGMESRATRLKKGGSRRTYENEYPVLRCRPGAKFEWTTNGFLHGVNYSDYLVEWDGETFRVTRPSLSITQLVEEQHLAGQKERQRALRWHI